MNRSHLVALLLLILGGAWLAWRTATTDMARVYVRPVEKRFVQFPDPGAGGAGVMALEPIVTEERLDPVWVDMADEAKAEAFADAEPISGPIAWTVNTPATPTEWAGATAEDPAQTSIVLSRSRTWGVWVAVFFTLAIFSFLWRDNPCYKIAESVVIGVSAAYWMVVAFWEVIVPNMVGNLWPHIIRGWAMPGLSFEPDAMYWVPMILGIMLLWRLSPKGGWISRWPLAFIIGVFCGLRLIHFIHADFLSQIRNSIVPLVVMDDTGLLFWDSVKNVVLIVGVLACLVYFFFSFEHKGFVGGTARLGMWFLMITFGAAFGYTVMGRIALLAIRLEFLFDDWLWLIDPGENHTLM